MRKVLPVALLFLCGCVAGGMDLPRYPGAMFINSPQQSGTVEEEGYTMYFADFETYDYIDLVGEYYNENRPEGWTGHYDKGQTMCVFTDGNILIERNLAQAKPKDPTREGGLILIAGGAHSEKTFIKLVRSVPKTK